MILSLLVAAAMPTQAIELVPVADVWIYPHAGDQLSDEFLRIWGIQGRSVPAKDQETDSFGWAVLKFDLSGLSGGNLKAAKLVLTHFEEASFTEEIAKGAPLEVRPIDADFSEKDWSYAKARTLLPSDSKDAWYGKAAPFGFKIGSPFSIEINLLEGPADFAKAVQDKRGKQLSFALTSTIDPSSGDPRPIYKVFSKDCDKKDYRPKLILVFGD